MRETENQEPKRNRYTLSLRFFSENLEPDEVTNLLGTKPTQSFRKGDDFSTPRKYQLRRYGAWILADRKWTSDPDLDVQINNLFNMLPDDLNIWNALAKYGVNLFCGISLGDNDTAFAFSAATLKRVAERSLAIQFDPYCVGDDD